MNKNERGVISPKDYAAKNKINQSVTMNNLPQNTFQLQPQSRRELLELSKLSRLPARKPFNLESAPTLNPSQTACVGCNGRIDRDDAFQQSIQVCRKCLSHYAKIDNVIDEASKRKRRELIAKFVGGENE